MVVAVLSVLIVTVTGAVSPVTTLASAQASTTTVQSAVVFLMQGENADVPGAETANDMYMLKILSVNLPYDQTRIYTKVAEDARDVDVWTSQAVLGNSSYGYEASGPHAGQFYIDVPSSHPRTSEYALSISTEQQFLAEGSVLVGVNYSAGALRLSEGNETGSYESTYIIPSTAHNLTSANVTFDGTYLDNVTCQVSNDNGTTWVTALNSTPVNFTSSGAALRFRFDIHGNVTLGMLPTISEVRVKATQVLLTTLFTVHISYLWAVKWLDGSARIDVSEVLPFSETGTYFLMVYVLRGYNATGAGLNLTFDSARSMNDYPDKDLYLFSGSPGEGIVSYSISVAAPKAESQTWMYATVAGVLVLLGLSYGYSRRKKAPTREHGEGPGESAEGPSRIMAEADEARRRELVARKKSLLARIEEVKAGMSSGRLTRAEAEAELSKLKTEFKTIRNELNRLARKAQAEAARPSEPVAGSEYNSVLALIARLDDDFERGRLPEATYKKVRADYVRRAAAILASGKRGEQTSAMESEKAKLMEAISALDEEHERGEVDDGLYAELRATYKKQLVDLIKESRSPGREE